MQQEKVFEHLVETGLFEYAAGESCSAFG